VQEEPHSSYQVRAQLPVNSADADCFTSHWRPIGDEPVVDYPLILGDASKLQLDHCREVTLKPLDGNQMPTSAFYAVWHPGQKKYHLSGMTRDEVAIFKQDDNSIAKARWVLHSSVRLPVIPDGASPRESLECRALVFHFHADFRERLMDVLKTRLTS
jgi:hypothetical protein